MTLTSQNPPPVILLTPVCVLPVGSCFVIKDSVLTGWVRGIRQAMHIRQLCRSKEDTRSEVYVNVCCSQQKKEKLHNS